jgi:hypothetical protein
VPLSGRARSSVSRSTPYRGAMPLLALPSLRPRPSDGQSAPRRGALALSIGLGALTTVKKAVVLTIWPTPLTATGNPADLAALAKPIRQGPARRHERWQPLLTAAVLDLVA